MKGNSGLVLYVFLMIVIVVAVDFLFFRHRFKQRLIANVLIVLAFVVFYITFVKHR